MRITINRLPIEVIPMPLGDVGVSLNPYVLALMGEWFLHSPLITDRRQRQTTIEIWYMAL